MLQYRWEDEKGNLFAKRVGTAYERYDQEVKEWQNGHRIEIHYGEITGKDFSKPKRAKVKGEKKKEVAVRARDKAWEWIVVAGEKFQVGDLVLVMVNKVEASSVDQIIIEVDAKSPTANINKDNLRKCHKQGKYTGIITEVYKGTYLIRLDIGVNAVAHSCNMSALPGKKDKIGFVVTRINDNYEVAEGIITRLIKRAS